MIRKEEIFFNNKWFDSNSKKFFRNKSFLIKKIYSYPNCNLRDLEMEIESAKNGLKLNKNLGYKLEVKIYIKFTIVL